ncbi:hypothetical protein LJC42_06960 [Eubacteriales bacterium OttesenSCG-928-K08]|nr:hypothetical protein [Eubacteriales bacterium OttesenSCG-928-K08]
MDIMQDIRELINPEGITSKNIIAAQKSFWNYSKLMNSKFFCDDRAYLRELGDTLQGVFEGTIINPNTQEPYKKLMINLPPRHGKSYSVTLFNQWMLGRNNDTRIISVSYNETLSNRFARQVRDGIDATKLENSRMIFSDVFPTTQIKHGDASVQTWSLAGQFFNFLATGFGGTMTGFDSSNTNTSMSDSRGNPSYPGYGG